MIGLGFGLGAGQSAQALMPQQQAPAAPFTWGSGGRMVTPEQAAAERARAQEMMAIDYSPIQSPWQGVARVLGNVLGAVDYRDTKKAQGRTAEANAEMMRTLSGAPGGPDGSSPPSGPNYAAAQAVLGNKFADPATRAIAENIVKQQQAREMKEFEADLKQRYPEIPSTVRMGMLGGLSQAESARRAFEATTDPEIVAPTPDGGVYIGPRSGLAAAFGGAPMGGAQPSGPQAGQVVDGFQFRGGDPNDRNNWVKVDSNNPNDPAENIAATSSASKTITRAEAEIIRAAGVDLERYLQTHGIKVIN